MNEQQALAARALSAVLPLLGWQSAAYGRWMGWAGNEETAPTVRQ